MGAAPSVTDGNARDGAAESADAEEAAGQLNNEPDDELDDQINDQTSQMSDLPKDRPGNDSGDLTPDVRVEEARAEHIFEETHELFGQWNMDCIEAMTTCEKDFASPEPRTQDGETNILPPRSAISMDQKLRSLLLRIHHLHSSTHKVVSTVERDAGSLRSGKKARAQDNPIKTLMMRVADVEKIMAMGMDVCGRAGGDDGAGADSANEQLAASAAHKHWDYISPFHQADVRVELGSKMDVKGFDVRIFGAAGCLVAVEAMRGAGLVEVTADAMACTGIGVHPNILNLVAAQRKVVADADGTDAPVVELVWEYVQGYTLEKMILSGSLCAPLRHQVIYCDVLLGTHPRTAQRLYWTSASEGHM